MPRIVSVTSRNILLVEIVIFEHFFFRWSSQDVLVYLDVLSIVPSTDIHMRIIVVLLSYIGHEGWFDLFSCERIPIKILKVGMVFDFINTTYPQTLGSLSLQQTID